MTAKQKNNVMSRDEIIETMRYLGWITHDQDGQLTDETYHVAGRLAGEITYGIMTPCTIASAVNEYRNSSRKHNGESI